MKPVFKLSRSNLIFFLVMFLGWIGLLFLNPPKAGFETGERLGNLIGLLLFPTLISWIVWLCSKRSSKAASVTFNVILGLSLLGQLSSGIQSSKNRAQLEFLLLEKDKMKTEALKSPKDGAEEFDKSRKEYGDNVAKSFKELESSSSGDEAEFYRIMGELVQKNNSADQEFTNVVRAVEDPGILNFELLLADDDYERQSTVIESYIKGIHEYQEHVEKIPLNLKTALSPVSHTAMAKGALKGGVEKFNKRKPHLDKLISAHSQYGKSLLELLTFMQEQKGSWSISEDGVEFESDEDIDRFNGFVDEIQSAEEAINSSSVKVIETM